MLKTNKILFDKLNKSGVRYVVYKGVSHLEQDLNGMRGDIDLLVEACDFEAFHDIVFCMGYKVVRKTGENRFYAKLDLESGLISLLDVVTSIPLGKKPFKYMGLPVRVSDFTVRRDIVNSQVAILCSSDDTKLSFLISCSENTLSEGHVSELNNLSLNIASSNRLEVIFLEIFGRNYKDEFLTKSASEIECQFHSSSYQALTIHKAELYRSKLSLVFRGYNKLLKLIGFPLYRVRKRGRLIAFVGVDGAGKSSVIEGFEKSPYFQMLAIKSIYFGNNNYWIPSLNKLAVKVKCKLGLRLLSIFTRIDRQLRIFVALYYMSLGRDVLADRYYYDDLYTRQCNAEKGKGMKSRVISGLRIMTSVKMVFIPDKTFFLDVSPRVSYKRKQDYSYEKLEKTVQGYRKLMVGRKEVIVINADEPLKVVSQTILNEIIS